MDPAGELDEVEQYLDHLVANSVLDHTGATASLSAERDEVHEQCCNAKREYFRYQLLWNALAALRGGGGRISSKCAARLELAMKHVCAASALACSALEDGTTLLGVELPIVPQLGEWRREIMNAVDAVMNETMRSIAAFNVAGSDAEEEPSECYEFISSRLCQLQEDMEELRERKLLRTRSMWAYYNMVGTLLSICVDILRKQLLEQQALRNSVNTEWVRAYSQTILLKLRVSEYQVVRDTYTPDAVKALRKIRALLDEQRATKRAELDIATTKLAQYDGAGEEFSEVVKEYAAIQEEIKNTHWALVQVAPE